MTIKDYWNRILNSEAVQDFVHELVAMELADAYENTKPENAFGDEDRLDLTILKEALRQSHNYYTTPDRHIHD